MEGVEKEMADYLEKKINENKVKPNNNAEKGEAQKRDIISRKYTRNQESHRKTVKQSRDHVCSSSDITTSAICITDSDSSRKENPKRTRRRKRK